MSGTATLIVGLIGGSTGASIFAPVVAKVLNRRRSSTATLGDAQVAQGITLSAARAQQELAEQARIELAAAVGRAVEAELVADRMRGKWREAEEAADHLIELLRRVTMERDTYGETLDAHRIARPTIPR